MYGQNRNDRVPEYICVRAIFGIFNSFTVKKVNFFTINVKFQVILSSKSGGGGILFCTGHPPHPKKWGIHPPISPGIYASEGDPPPARSLRSLAVLIEGPLTRIFEPPRKISGYGPD